MGTTFTKECIPFVDEHDIRKWIISPSVTNNHSLPSRVHHQLQCKNSFLPPLEQSSSVGAEVKCPS